MKDFTPTPQYYQVPFCEACGREGGGRVAFVSRCPNPLQIAYKRQRDTDDAALTLLIVNSHHLDISCSG